MALRNVGSILLVIAGVAVLSACSPDPAETKIIERTVSPDGTREVVHAQEIGGGATVAATDDVYVMKVGDALRFTNRIFSADRVCHLLARWSSKDEIDISYAAKRRHIERSVFAHERVRVVLHWLGPDAANGC